MKNLSAALAVAFSLLATAAFAERPSTLPDATAFESALNGMYTRVLTRAQRPVMGDPRPEAVQWADAHVQGLTQVPPELRVAVYYAVSIFYRRLLDWRAYKPFYDGVYADPAFARRYPTFADPEKGPFLAVLVHGQKLTDLAPYARLRGMTVEQVFGYPGDHRSMDDLEGEGSRCAAVIVERDLKPVIKGVNQNLYHEFGHLLHLSLLSPEEFGRVEAAYRHAKEKDIFLDDYAAQNSSEYFAVALEAYLSETKNETWRYYRHTRAEVQLKDPELYAVVDDIVRASR